MMRPRLLRVALFVSFCTAFVSVSVGQTSILTTPMRLAATQDALIDSAWPATNFASWTTASGEAVLTLDGTKIALLQWDFQNLANRLITGDGTLEIYTHSTLHLSTSGAAAPLIRVRTINPAASWTEATVTYTSFVDVGDLDSVLSQSPVGEATPTRNRLTRTVLSIPEAALLSLQDGSAAGLALQLTGPMALSLFSREAYAGLYAARLAFNVRSTP